MRTSSTALDTGVVGAEKPATAPGPVKSIMICGAGHSGSTLLGLLLGSHSQAFYIGEGGKAAYLDDARKPLRKRACKLCGEDCPVWAHFRWDHARPLHTQVAYQVGRPVVIDSTKNLDWIRARTAEMAAAGGRAHLLLLLRDGRAVVNSRLRKYPERDPGSQIRAWVSQIAASEALFDAFAGPKLRVRYEELATRTDDVVRQICAAAGLVFEPAMLRFHEVRHHPLGGNNGAQYIAARAQADCSDRAASLLAERNRAYYRQHVDGIRLDLRWRGEMARGDLALFDRLAGDFNREYRWDG